ncbi:SirB2 family protein [Accumulibacter sp.]|uniref:SirB2 family protein n=1 Tax=Accumulibacter sp. TaxID=2053492 RepID=UPI002615C999|nr:SirB2 family protein [Accumulibacter sp.]
MDYLILKHLHVSCVALSGTGFFLRGLLMLYRSPWRQLPLVRVLPHVIDTALLASALAMTVISAQYPFVADWLTAKLLGLVIYIACGTMALKRARTQSQRAAFFVAALFAFTYIVSVALTRHVLGPLVWIT